MNREEMEKIIQEQKPNVVGISSLFTTYAEEALEVARITKEIDPEIITIMGGTHPTLFPHHCLNSPFVDYVIRGEGETPLFRLIEALKTGDRKGIARASGASFKHGADLNISKISVEDTIDLIPDRSLVNSQDYRIGRREYSSMLTSRGCPFNCAFCGKPPVPYRRRTIASIEQEIDQCLHMGIEAIDFEDDMLNLDLTFFHRVLKSFHDTGIQLSAMNGLYAGTLDKKTLGLMHEAGFRRLNFSLVDSSQEIHHAQKRKFPAHFSTLLTYLESSPFLMEAHFIIGLPEQKPDDIIETMIFLMGKRLLPGPSVYYLVPNSSLFNAAIGSDWQRYMKVMRSSALYPSNPLFQRATIFTFMKLTRFINVIKNIIDQNSSIERLSEIVDIQDVTKGHHDAHILKTLISDKRFVWYDTKKADYADEPQDKTLVSHFFEKIHGKAIRGFKTPRTLTVDV